MQGITITLGLDDQIILSFSTDTLRPWRVVTEGGLRCSINGYLVALPS